MDARGTETIKQLARAEGFGRAGVADLEGDLHADVFADWLRRGWHGEMDYLARNVRLRRDPAHLVADARSVLCLAVGYAPSAPSASPIARYARGRDYHKVLKKRCHRLMDRIHNVEPAFAGRAFVDSAPILERSLAVRAGLGWIGRNGCLIVPGLGSYVVLAEIVSNLPLKADPPIEATCQGCDQCAFSCPTGALRADGLVDARQCISYLTIEHRGEIDSALWPRMGCSLFGCDRCQQCCPHNADLPAGDAELAPSSPPLAGAGLADVLRWSQADWDRATRGTALRRAAWPQLLRNAAIAAGNVPPGDRRAGDLAKALRELPDSHPIPPDLVAWAQARLARGGPSSA